MPIRTILSSECVFKVTVEGGRCKGGEGEEENVIPGCDTGYT